MRKISLVLAVVFCFSFFFFGGCEKEEKRSFYEIDCMFDGENKITGREKFTYFNDTENSVKELKFNLYANAFKKDAKYSPIIAQYKNRAYYNGESYGYMSILKVKSEGEELKNEIAGEDENILIVYLNKEIFPDESVCVVIDYEIVLAKVVARTGINAKTVNLANFYPVLCARDENGFYECVYYGIGDPYFCDCADYSVSITLDKKYVVASSGKVEKSEEFDDMRKITYSLKNARSFAFVLCKDFESATDSTSGVNVSYYFYEDEDFGKSLETAVKSIKLFNEKYGVYPYEQYSVVQTGFIEGGMEFSGLVFISDELEESAKHEVIVHETAHQWWQNGVGNNETEYGFLDEGLAEYSMVVFFENYPEYGLNRKDMIASAEQVYKTFYSVSEKVFGKVDTKMVRSLKDFNSEYEYVNIAYIKPCIMFELLRKTIGDEKFFKGLKEYYSGYLFKNATPDCLIGAFLSVGAKSDGFLNSFFNGTAII